MRMRSQTTGITLIELCFALAIVGLLAGLAVPGFRQALHAAAVRTAAHELMAGLQQARSSAIVEARPGILCLTNAAGECAASAGLPSSGWRSFLEAGATRKPLASRQLPAGVSLRATRDPLRFLPTSLTASTGTLTICDDAKLVPALRIVVSHTGRARLAPASDAECG